MTLAVAFVVVVVEDVELHSAGREWTKKWMTKWIREAN